jgi:large subunit ribosomal protein L35
MAKNKLKTHKGAAKRFKLTKSGKVKRGHAFRSHILNKKSTKRKRGLRQIGYASSANEATIKVLIPYK